MSDFRVIGLPTFRDRRGHLTVMQDALPFEVRRTFWIAGADNIMRGGHRHRNTRQALIAVSGTVYVKLNDGKTKHEVRLDRQDKCLIVEPDDWHVMVFAPESILLVFASHSYDIKDYIDAEY